MTFAVSQAAFLTGGLHAAAVFQLGGGVENESGCMFIWLSTQRPSGVWLAAAGPTLRGKLRPILRVLSVPTAPSSLTGKGEAASAVQRHGRDQLLHLVGQALLPGLLVLVQRRRDLCRKDKHQPLRLHLDSRKTNASLISNDGEFFINSQRCFCRRLLGFVLFVVVSAGGGNQRGRRPFQHGRFGITFVSPTERDSPPRILKLNDSLTRLTSCDVPNILSDDEGDAEKRHECG